MKSAKIRQRLSLNFHFFFLVEPRLPREKPYVSTHVLENSVFFYNQAYAVSYHKTCHFSWPRELVLYETLLAPKRPDSSAVTSSRSFLNAIPIDQMCVIFTRIITMIYF